MSERRVVDEKTGAAKGVKLARFDLIPWAIIRELAEHYGRGARKYADRNWEKGYAWSLSFGALHRHLEAFWNRDEIDHDPSLYEDGEPHTTRHIIAVVWHALVLAFYSKYGRGTDDRPTDVEPDVPLGTFEARSFAAHALVLRRERRERIIAILDDDHETAEKIMEVFDGTA